MDAMPCHHMCMSMLRAVSCTKLPMGCGSSNGGVMLCPTCCMPCMEHDTLPVVVQVVFRCDMLPLAALIGLHMLLAQQCTLRQAVCWGAAAVLLALSVTIAVDSLFWRRLLWPEGEVLWFNSVLNK